MVSTNKLIALLLSINISLQLSAMVSINAFEDRAQKPIIMFGDRHNIDLPIHNDLFELFLLRMKQKGLSQPVPFLLEADENLTDNTIASTTVNKLLEFSKSDWSTDNLDLILYEPREHQSDYLADIYLYLHDVIQPRATVKDIQKHYQRDAPWPCDAQTANSWEITKQEIIQGMEKEAFKSNPSITVGVYHTYLQSNLKKIKTLLKKYKKNNNPHMVTQLTKSIETYEEAQQKIGELLSNAPETEDLTYVIMNDFTTNKTIVECMQWYDEYNKNFLEDTDYLFAECFFLDKIITILNTKPCLCLLVGQGHSIKLTQQLQKIGYTHTKEANDVSFSCALWQEFGSLTNLKGMIKKFKDTIILSTQLILKSLLKPNICHNCFKAFDDILQCNRCKTAHYCSANCQKAQWKTHKKICKAPITNSND